MAKAGEKIKGKSVPASQEDKWVIDFESKVQSLSQNVKEWKKHSIYKVRPSIRDLNKKAYEPQVVSFGPYHHTDEKLRPMNEHKERALLHFLKRADVHEPLKACLTALDKHAQELMDAYDQLEGELEKDKFRFLKMMILDGCFMLELFLTESDVHNDYDSADPIFSSHGRLHIMTYIKRDMLMIENQIPFLVLNELAKFIHKKCDAVSDMNKLVTGFFHADCISKEENPLHVLDLYRISLLQGSWPETSKSECSTRSLDYIIRSVTELTEYWVKFERSKVKGVRNIKFQNGTLSVPLLIVNDNTEYTFRNLMAFEGQHVRITNHDITSYVFFMDNIIDTASDVSLLHSKKILQNELGSDEAVATLFNQLSQDVVIKAGSYLDKMSKDVEDYCNTFCRKQRAELWHKYFKSPWAFISLMAAFVLLVLTVIQTVFTVYSAFQKK